MLHGYKYELSLLCIYLLMRHMSDHGTVKAHAYIGAKLTTYWH
jgi:hypothetical protein